MENYLAKSSGVDLVNHSDNVLYVSHYLLRSMYNSIDDELYTSMREGAALHDIGKITEGFQNMLLGKTKNTNQKFRHNEIGWAFSVKYLNIETELGANLIYWHHGITNNLEQYCCEDILDTVSEKDITNLKTFVLNLFGQDMIKSDKEIKETLIKTPLFYKFDKEYNRKFGILRTCLLFADRLVSSLEEIDENITINEKNVFDYVNKHIINDIYTTNGYTFDKSPYKGQERFDLQKQISNQALTKQTTVIKATAGFGKTMIGLLWSLATKKRLIWVCPRNIVTVSVYDSIIRELNALGLTNITVELFLTGKKEKSNHYRDKEFDSDIIVTNIDNFEKPTIDDGISKRLFLLHSANVVFDEFHEFVGDEPYYALFINIMNIRNKNTDASTLLLSATGVDIYSEWEGINNKTQILPSRDTHYPAIHSKKYLIRVKDEFIYDKSGSDLVIFNSISEAQARKFSFSNYNNQETLLFHGEFTKEDKEKIYEELMSLYGKKIVDGEVQIKETTLKTVIATIIAQASIDVSFDKLYESCTSPEASLQRAGRCRRHDDYPDEISPITIFKPKDINNPNLYSRAEAAVVDILYDRKLMELWFKELLQYDGKTITLDEYYEIYNSHTKKYKPERDKYFKNKLRLSLQNLSKIYPIKYNSPKKESSVITAGSNKLRSLGSETFFIAPKHDDPNDYVGLFNRAIYVSHSKDFNEKGNIQRRLLGSMKTIMDKGITEYDYSEILKKKKRITLDEIRSYGKKSDTPYIRYDVVYHPDYGLISLSRLNSFKK